MRSSGAGACVTTLVMGAAVFAACTFPDITVNVSNPASGGGADATVSSSDSGSGASTSSVTASASSGGGPAGSGGACIGFGGGGSGGIDCDKDGDGELDAAAPCCGTDCDDDDDHVFSAQSAYFDVPSKHHGYDYDCDSKDEGDPMQLFNLTGDVSCDDTLCLAGAHGYSKNANCGQLDTGQYFECQAVTCKVVTGTTNEKLRCK